jgi:acyl-CoA synthetase (AMP-forming)/AMP-acid ligase II
MSWEQLLEPSHTGGVTFADSGKTLAWMELDYRAGLAAQRLGQFGVDRGDAVALILENTEAGIAALLALWRMGAVPVSLPTSPRGINSEEYAGQVRRCLTAAGARVVLVPESGMKSLASTLPARVIGAESLLGVDGDAPDECPPAQNETAFVQFSSGTTGDPRGAVLSGRAIGAQLSALANRLSLTASDRLASWLPLSHDMGLFGGLLLARFMGMALTLSSPGRFVRAPSTWLNDCVESSATLTPVTPTGLSIGARRWHGPGSLSSLARVVVGGDRVEWHALQSSSARLQTAGLRPCALTPAYGMAEATLAVTIDDLGTSPSCLWVHGPALADGEVREVQADQGTPIVAVGTPLSGTTLRAPADSVGTLEITSPSAARGYIGNAAASAATFRDGSIITPDLGFMRQDQLYVVAREDDVAIVDGRNVDAAWVEQSLARVPGVRPGSCALVVQRRASGGSLVVVVVETAAKGKSLERLYISLRRCGLGVAGISIHGLLAVSKHALPKTPSGKLRRHRCSELVQTPPENARVVGDIA